MIPAVPTPEEILPLAEEARAAGFSHVRFEHPIRNRFWERYVPVFDGVRARVVGRHYSQHVLPSGEPKIYVSSVTVELHVTDVIEAVRRKKTRERDLAEKPLYQGPSHLRSRVNTTR